ncbi:MAG TPA: hypothetical protein VJG83_03330 [archaeon]|nr:hypothetical protein [archaeon]
MRNRKPMKKITKYTLKITPNQTREISLRGRAKPRKLRLSQVEQFNKMIQQGIIGGPKFNEVGEFIGLEKMPSNLTKGQKDTIIRIVNLTSAAGKTMPKSPAYRLNKKWDAFMLDHQRRGSFLFLHPSFELTLLSGESVRDFLHLAESLHQTRLPILREQISRFNTKEKVYKNLKIELRYFEELLKRKGVKEMVILEELSAVDKTTTKIKLLERGVEKETIAHCTVPPFGDIIQLVILPLNGKLSYRELIKE